MGLQPVESYCLARRLDADPSLRDALAGDNPQRSPRWQDLTDIAADCIRVTTSAVNFANGIQDQLGAALSAETLACLRDSYARLSPDETAALIRAALNPGTTDPHIQQQFNDLLDRCGVDVSKLPH